MDLLIQFLLHAKIQVRVALRDHWNGMSREAVESSLQHLLQSAQYLPRCNPGQPALCRPPKVPS